MNKSILVIVSSFLIFLLCISTNAQIKVTTSGHVRIGGITPSSSLHINNDNSSAIINLQNGNDVLWKIGNYVTSPWGAPNTLAICTEANSPRMEFRSENTFINDRLKLGVGFVSSTEPVFELQDQSWMMLSASANSII